MPSFGAVRAVLPRRELANRKKIKIGRVLQKRRKTTR